jgi:hypothetical protein
MGVALAALGLNARCESNGGKNKGYQIQHLDPEEEYENGEKVLADGQTYSVGRDTYKVRQAQLSMSSQPRTDRSISGYRWSLPLRHQCRTRSALRSISQCSPDTPRSQSGNAHLNPTSSSNCNSRLISLLGTASVPRTRGTCSTTLPITWSTKRRCR